MLQTEKMEFQVLVGRLFKFGEMQLIQVLSVKTNFGNSVQGAI